MVFIRAALILFCISASLIAAENTSSLYDPKTAQKPTAEKASLFGPKSSNYRYDSRMMRAAEIAAARARKHSTSRCWRYVKTAMLAANVIDSYPSTAYAKQAGAELYQRYGFKKIDVRDPYKAPVGAVLVYGGNGAGHVEIRTKSGFVSDFASATPSPRPLIGVYIKPKA
jgi:hypothetical protein